MTALVERWMDFTYTFQFPFEEITITPLDFTTITSMSFTMAHVLFSVGPYNSSLATYNVWVIKLFEYC